MDKLSTEMSITYSDKSSYVGQCKEFKRHGFGKFQQGDLTFEGHWEMDKKHGIGKLLEGSSIYYTGRWKNNKKEGLFCVSFPDKQSVYREYQNDVLISERKHPVQLESHNMHEEIAKELEKAMSQIQALQTSLNDQKEKLFLTITLERQLETLQSLLTAEKKQVEQWRDRYEQVSHTYETCLAEQETLKATLQAEMKHGTAREQELQQQAKQIAQSQQTIQHQQVWLKVTLLVLCACLIKIRFF